MRGEFDDILFEIIHVFYGRNFEGIILERYPSKAAINEFNKNK